MGNFIKLNAKDGHSFGVYEAGPSDRLRGGLVVIRQIFNRYGNQAWHETSATLARHRTINVLHEKVG